MPAYRSFLGADPFSRFIFCPFLFSSPSPCASLLITQSPEQTFRFSCERYLMSDLRLYPISFFFRPLPPRLILTTHKDSLADRCRNPSYLPSRLQVPPFILAFLSLPATAPVSSGLLPTANLLSLLPSLRLLELLLFLRGIGLSK